MARLPLYLIKVAGWEQTLGAFIAHAADFVEFEPRRERLVEITDRFKLLINQRAAFDASKQETTREIQDLFQEAETLVDHLRTAARQLYGLSNERLVEFGIRPTRRSRRPKAAPGPEAPAPAEQASSTDAEQ